MDVTFFLYSWTFFFHGLNLTQLYVYTWAFSPLKNPFSVSVSDDKSLQVWECIQKQSKPKTLCIILNVISIYVRENKKRSLANIYESNLIFIFFLINGRSSRIVPAREAQLIGIQLNGYDYDDHHLWCCNKGNEFQLNVLN